MKKLVSFFAIALLTATAAKAQTADAVTIGSMTVTIPISEVDGSGSEYRTTTTKAGNISNEVLILRTSTGQIEYAMKSSNISITNADGSRVDAVATNEVIAALAEAAVVQGYVYGYSNEELSKVWSENCIVRSGSGEYTRFAPCSSTTKTCYNAYSVSESPDTFETTATFEASCPDCPTTTYTVTNTVR
jgi:hypothetical protein